jgi:hypothetical protein
MSPTRATESLRQNLLRGPTGVRRELAETVEPIACGYLQGGARDSLNVGLGRICPEFRGKRKWRNLLLTKQIAREGEGGLRHEQTG